MKVGTISAHEDDLGNKWLIEPGDPGQRALLAAKHLRIKGPALPHEVLMGHQPRISDWRPFETAAESFDVTALRRIYTANQIRERLRKEWALGQQ